MLFQAVSRFIPNPGVQMALRVFLDEASLRHFQTSTPASPWLQAARRAYVPDSLTLCTCLQVLCESQASPGVWDRPQKSDRCELLDAKHIKARTQAHKIGTRGNQCREPGVVVTHGFSMVKDYGQDLGILCIFNKFRDFPLE